MILYIILLGALAWPSSRCEPPINSYLPPSGSGPSGGGSNLHNGSSGRNIGGGPRGSQPGGVLANSQDSYSTGQSGASIDTQYGSPAARNNVHNSQGFGSPSGSGGYNQGRGSTPSSQYGVPNQGGGSRGTSRSSKLISGIDNSNEGGSFRSGSSGFGQGPQTSYGPPPTGVSANGLTSQRLTSQGSTDSSYQSPSSFGSGGRQSGGSPSSTYGAPGFGGNANLESIENFGTSQSGDFASANNGDGRGSGRSQNYEEGESNEPAKYEFSYDVDDSETGTKFGHSEQRDGALATGEYNVVLPDGRKQVVEYEAGTQGYKPQIRYEGGVTSGSGSGFGHDGPNGQGRSQGYTQGGLDDLSGIGPDQELRSERYQEAGEFGNGDSNSLGFMGYPSGRPGGQNGAGSRNPGKSQSGSQFPSGSSSDSLNGGQGNGYPSGGPQGGSIGGNRNGSSGRNGSSSSNKGNGEGYPRGGPGKEGVNGYSGGQNGGSSRSDSQNGANEGYPSGGPSGPRGSGY